MFYTALAACNTNSARFLHTQEQFGSQRNMKIECQQKVVAEVTINPVDGLIINKCNASTGQKGLKLKLTSWLLQLGKVNKDIFKQPNDITFSYYLFPNFSHNIQLSFYSTSFH